MIDFPKMLEYIPELDRMGKNYGCYDCAHQVRKNECDRIDCQFLPVRYTLCPVPECSVSVLGRHWSEGTANLDNLGDDLKRFMDAIPEQMRDVVIHVTKEEHEFLKNSFMRMKYAPMVEDFHS